MAAFDPVSIVSGTVGKISDLASKFIVDKTKVAELNAGLVQIIAEHDTAQSDINKVEAASSHLFVAGWRPALGWICDIGIAINFIANPLLGWIGWMSGANLPGVHLDIASLITLLTLLLGNGAARTVEKYLGVDSK